MELARCLRIAPLAVLVVAGAAGIRPPVAAEGAASWVPPDCRSTRSAPPGRQAAGAASFRLVPVLDGSGTLRANALLVRSGGTMRRIELPPESSASAAPGGRILVTTDDGTTSTLRIVDPGRGCESMLAEESAVIRSAVRLPGGDVVEHRVDRTTRADLGVWRRPASGGTPARILAPIADDPRFGRTFNTELRLATDGRLAVSSCGIEACRVRVVDPSDGHVDEVDGTGPALGVTGRWLVVRDACGGFPCPVRAVRLDGSGPRKTLVAAAGIATLDDSGLTYETAHGGVRTLDLEWSR